MCVYMWVVQYQVQVLVEVEEEVLDEFAIHYL
jgi:hypothetical protein